MAIAFSVGGRGRHHSDDSGEQAKPVLQPWRWLGTLTFSCVLAHWILTYTVPETDLAWPLGVALALTPIAFGLVMIPRLATTGPYGSDGVRVIVGLLTFFVVLDIVVGVLGRYDMIISAIVTTFLVCRLYVRRFSLAESAATMPIPGSS